MDRIAEQPWSSSYTYQVSKHSAEMLHNLNVQRRTGGRFCDVLLRVGEESFPAHKAVLAACSEYFESVFSCQAEGDGETKELEMHTISPKVFKDILDFAYTSKIVVRLECFPELMTAAKFLLMRSVIEICQEVIKHAAAGGGAPGLVAPPPAGLLENGLGLHGGGPADSARKRERTRRHVGCDVCGKVFRDVYHLNRHKLSHSGEKPYACPVCGLRFKRKDRMSYHVRSHDGSVGKPYVCQSCGKGFSRPDHLNGHIKQVHTSERPHKCQTCNASFATRDRLRSHLACHEDKIPCQVCGKYLRAAYMTDHLKKHSEGPHNYCSICNKGSTPADNTHTPPCDTGSTPADNTHTPPCDTGSTPADNTHTHTPPLVCGIRPGTQCSVNSSGNTPADKTHTPPHDTGSTPTDNTHTPPCDTGNTPADNTHTHLPVTQETHPLTTHTHTSLWAGLSSGGVNKHTDLLLSLSARAPGRSELSCPHQDSQESSDASFGELSDSGDLKQHKAEEEGLGFGCGGGPAAGGGAPKLRPDGDKKHACTECGHAFRSKSYLSKHMQKAHVGPQKGLVGAPGPLGDLAPALSSPFSPQQNMSLLESFGFQIVQSAFASSLADPEAGHSGLGLGGK
ncbi:PATZ1 protein, partial [Atractosteus spatula]|nr:PATZ1 protein [Atractosteus spatula]